MLPPASLRAGKSCAYVRKFCQELEAAASIPLPPIVLLDERLTTHTVKTALREGSKVSMKTHKKRHLDMMCAALILQRALDQLSAS